MMRADAVLFCSRDVCQCRWTVPVGAELSLVPVVERTPDGDRRWHPCPTCLDTFGPIAEFAHDMRARTATELAAYGLSA